LRVVVLMEAALYQNGKRLCTVANLYIVEGKPSRIPVGSGQTIPGIRAADQCTFDVPMGTHIEMDSHTEHVLVLKGSGDAGARRLLIREHEWSGGGVSAILQEQVPVP
jgi:hypothetical protein